MRTVPIQTDRDLTEHVRQITGRHAFTGWMKGRSEQLLARRTLLQGQAMEHTRIIHRRRTDSLSRRLCAS
jgi:hypothetical protein